MNALVRVRVTSIETTPDRPSRTGTVRSQTAYVFIKDGDEFPEKTVITLWNGEPAIPVGDYNYDLRKAFHIDARQFNRPALRFHAEQLAPVTVAEVKSGKANTG